MQAEQNIQTRKMDHEYAPISGSADFCNLSIKLALGDDSSHVKEGLVSLYSNKMSLISV